MCKHYNLIICETNTSINLLLAINLLFVRLNVCVCMYVGFGMRFMEYYDIFGIDIELINEIRFLYDATKSSVLLTNLNWYAYLY